MIIHDLPSLKLTEQFAPENGWLEDEFPLGRPIFRGYVSFRVYNLLIYIYIYIYKYLLFKCIIMTWLVPIDQSLGVLLCLPDFLHTCIDPGGDAARIRCRRPKTKIGVMCNVTRHRTCNLLVLLFESCISSFLMEISCNLISSLGIPSAPKNGPFNRCWIIGTRKDKACSFLGSDHTQFAFIAGKAAKRGWYFWGHVMANQPTPP